jgi:hypothetical protein
VGHIEGLQVIVRHMHGAQRETNIAAMAQWVADYRQTMSPEEKESLNAYLHTGPGRQTVQQATAKYLSQDVYYRAATASVIHELLTTISDVRKP